MRLKELRGLPVIDPTAARKVGTIADFQVDPASGRLAAVDVTRVQGGEGERILAQRIRRVGTHAVILTARGGTMPGSDPETVERWLDASTLDGLEVIGDDGNRVGSVVDAVFNQDTLDVEGYVLRASLLERLIGRGGRIQPGKVHSCSRELMVVNTGRVTEPAPAAEPAVAVEPGITLKEEDRLPAPTFEQVPDGQPVGQPS